VVQYYGHCPTIGDRGYNESLSSLQTIANFGPLGNFAPFLAISVASLDQLCTKNEQNRICITTFIGIFLFDFSAGRVLMIASTSGRNVFILYLRFKVRRFEGRYVHRTPRGIAYGR
jgi:hypothetical protein